MTTSVSLRLFRTTVGIHSMDTPAQLRVYSKPLSNSDVLWCPMLLNTFERRGSSEYLVHMSVSTKRFPSTHRRKSGNMPSDSPTIGFGLSTNSSGRSAGSGSTTVSLCAVSAAASCCRISITLMMGHFRVNEIGSFACHSAQRCHCGRIWTSSSHIV